jgi:hypothetical protein
MTIAAGLALTLLAAPIYAGTAYVSDELVLGVYAEQNNQGQRLTTLHSGASVEALSVNGEFTQVRLNDGTTGWVKSAYLTTREPAIVRVKQLEEELDRSRATTPALAEAAARSEVEQLKRELADKQSELDALHGSSAAPAAAARSGPDLGVTAAAGARGSGIAKPWGTLWMHVWTWPLVAVAALAGGFWLGYAALARRVRHKFGGIKVY